MIGYEDEIQEAINLVKAQEQKKQDQEVIDIVNKKRNQEEQEAEEFDPVERSTKGKAVKKKTRSENKVKGYKSTIVKVILVTALTTSLLVGTPQIINEVQTQTSSNEIMAILGEGAINNDINSAAAYVLNENSTYDIDSRIYGCYDQFPSKGKQMDELFATLSQMVSTGEYSEKITSICSAPTFAEYLTNKGLSETEWVAKMKDIIRDYAEGRLAKVSLNENLQDLNIDLGSNYGGR